MPRNVELLACRGEPLPNREFLLEYQRCILLALEKEGLLLREQVGECMFLLEKYEV